MAYDCCNPITGYEHWPPHNPFKYRGSMYWNEIAPMLRRNANLHSCLKFNFYPNIWPDRVTIMDWHLPEMAIRTGIWKPNVDTLGQASTSEYEAHAIVCNIGWLDGECPMDTLPMEFYLDENGAKTTKIKKHKVRGVMEAVEAALDIGALRPTVELGLLTNNHRMVTRCFNW